MDSRNKCYDRGVNIEPEHPRDCAPNGYQGDDIMCCVPIMTCGYSGWCLYKTKDTCTERGGYFIGYGEGFVPPPSFGFLVRFSQTFRMLIFEKSPANWDCA